MFQAMCADGSTDAARMAQQLAALAAAHPQHG
jgi:hypothetical protein